MSKHEILLDSGAAGPAYNMRPVCSLNTCVCVTVCTVYCRKRRTVQRRAAAVMAPGDDEVHYTPGCHPSPSCRHTSQGRCRCPKISPGCHVISANGAATTQKRSGGYCDCTWSPHELLQRTSLIWHAVDSTPTDTKTYDRTTSGGTNSTSGRHTLMTSSSNMATPDLFADDSSQSGLAGSINAELAMSTLGGATPRIATTHFYESPIFSHRERLLNGN